ncbi:hypothetical protein Cadr_000012926 [Camelus dromedarius]|uniref:Uncharacterized protein n=1 Tax=Camelus dromedarius TaxID=9838 RepID=A0A5N4D9A5_CAMDR|nr:hypothetical protein Cadr_000012926 [Camelus dromedarius]
MTPRARFCGGSPILTRLESFVSGILAGTGRRQMNLCFQC